jgi:hypothetical protein
LALKTPQNAPEVEVQTISGLAKCSEMVDAMHHISGHRNSACGVHKHIRDWYNSDSAPESYEAIILVAIIVAVGCEQWSKKSSDQNHHNKNEEISFHDCTSIYYLVC